MVCHVRSDFLAAESIELISKIGLGRVRLPAAPLPINNIVGLSAGCGELFESSVFLALPFFGSVVAALGQTGATSSVRQIGPPQKSDAFRFDECWGFSALNPDVRIGWLLSQQRRHQPGDASDLQF